MIEPLKLPRKTFAQTATRSGPALLTGEQCTVTLRPADAGHGIVLRHMPTDTLIPADLAHVVDTPQCTSLSSGEARIDFTEHLLAVLSANGVTDALIEVDGTEIPLLDGSAAEYQAAAQEAGLVPLGDTYGPIVLTEAVTVSAPNRGIMALPGAPQYWYLLDHSHPRIGRQAACYDPLADDFARQVAPARTFSTEEEARALIEARGLEGADISMSNIAFADRLAQPEPFANSFAMHKVLDMLGDLYLLGRPVIGRIVAHRTGHADNRALAARIAETLTDNTEAT